MKAQWVEMTGRGRAKEEGVGLEVGLGLTCGHKELRYTLDIKTCYSSFIFL